MSSKWLLSLYPEPWRSRYQDEFVALLEQCLTSPQIIIDVLFGAMDAQLHLERVLDTQLTSLYRLRRSVFSILSACVLVLIGVWIFSGTVDDSPFATAMGTHEDLATLWLIMEISGGVAAAGLLISSILIASAVFKEALTGKRQNLWLALSPLFSITSMALYIFFVTRFIDPIASPAVRLVFGNGLWAVSWVSIVASVVCICRVIRRSNIGERTFHFNLAVNRITALAMSSMVITSLLWFVTARLALISAFNSSSPGFLTMQPSISFAVGILVMLLGTAMMGRTLLKSVAFSSQGEVTR